MLWDKIICASDEYHSQKGIKSVFMERNYLLWVFAPIFSQILERITAYNPVGNHFLRNLIGRICQMASRTGIASRSCLPRQNSAITWLGNKIRSYIQLVWFIMNQPASWCPPPKKILFERTVIFLSEVIWYSLSDDPKGEWKPQVIAHKLPAQGTTAPISHSPSLL